MSLLASIRLNWGLKPCYVIGAEGTIRIDGGAPKQARNFMKGIEILSIKAEDIQLIVLTHGHWDHIGSVKEIKEITGAKIALHRNEKDWLEKLLKPLPPAVTTGPHICRDHGDVFAVGSRPCSGRRCCPG